MQIFPSGLSVEDITLGQQLDVIEIDLHSTMILAEMLRVYRERSSYPAITTGIRHTGYMRTPYHASSCSIS